jgi:hypothetical protein
MSQKTFACPSCGSRSTLANGQCGEQIDCTCGLSYTAAPVFAIADATQKKKDLPGWVSFVLIAVIACCCSLTAWFVIPHF